ncbi:hypothetical protein [Methanobrevibacter sp.]|uniref:hypothetical protein n=1 Tax=Methanobrevibacter sp. TaxID=66852 RepID=UPI0026DF674C|nr:hypothetical protein [Methanobrevibacter sp.]MDO5860651.1 hypothetical protein [Methanobrevibacter sp.]
MLKKTQKIATGKNFLISMLFICLIFATFGLNMDDSYAVDLNETGSGMEIGLDVEDTLENSHDELASTVDNQENRLLSAVNSRENEILTGSYVLNGGTFSDIQNRIDRASAGDKIYLNGNFVSESNNDGIVVNKRLDFISGTSATLNGKNSVGIISVTKNGGGSTFTNLKFINGYAFRGGAIYLEGNSVVIDNCVFQKNHAYGAGGALGADYNSTVAKSTTVKNCKFSSNVANRAGGALALYGKNTKITNCSFTLNRVDDTYGVDCYGGAIQLGMDEDDYKGYVTDCTFRSNSVNSKVGHTHGGAGCIRNGVVYKGCKFINNSADEGGALTYHASGTIKDCTFSSNTAKEFGGALSTGLILQHSMVLNIVNCTFKNNNAPLGGAAQLNGRNIEIDDCNFYNNHASKNGGAINTDALTVVVKDSSFKGNIAEKDGGAVFIKGKNTTVVGSSFRNNSAIPDKNKYSDGLGGAIYVNSTRTNIEDNSFYYNTARNGSAVYYDKSGSKLVFVNNTMYQNQAWVYALPIFAKNIYCGETEEISSIIHGGNNIARYGDLAVSNAIYNAASYSKIKVDGESPLNGATDNGRLYQDDREYNMEIELTVEKDDGTLIYSDTLNSDYLGEVSAQLNNLAPGKYYVTAKHFEDTYYKAISNRTIFTVTSAIDSKIRKVSSSENYNFEDVVVWTLTITNGGPNKATGVVVTDVIPEGLIYLRDDSGGNYDPATGSLAIGDLDVGETRIINIYTIVNKTGEITNNANVTSNEYDIDLTNNHDDASINVPPTSDLQIIKLVNNTSPNYNDLVKWTLVVKNNGPDVAHDVVAKDILPKSLIWVSNDGNYNHNTGIWNIGTLNVDGEVRLNIVSRVNSTGVIANYASVTGREYDYDLTNNNASQIIRVSPSSDLSIVKSVNVTNANFNDLVKWTLVVKNNGPDNATGVIVTDILPEGFIYVNSRLGKGSYSDGVINVGQLAVGEKVTLEIISKVKVTGTYINVANITGNEYDWDLTNNRDEESILIYPASDLEVIKTVNDTNPSYGKYVTWTVVVRNNGPDIANDAMAIDVLPKSLIWVSDNGNGKYNHHDGRWNIGQINPDASVKLDIICSVNATGIIQNNVSVSAREFDYDLSNNNDSEIVDINKTADVEIVKMVDDVNPYYGYLIKWTLIARNNGPDKATSVSVSDVLPEGLILLDVEASKGVYDNGVWAVCCLENGEEQTLEMVCIVNKTGNITNFASISADEVDPDPTNNHDSETIHVPLTVDLEVVKEVSNKNPYFGEPITWMISIKNNGPDRATNVVLYDLLDDGLIFEDYTSTKGDFIGDKWIIGQLNSHESAYLNISCFVNSLGEISNVAFANSTEYDLNESNNNDSEFISVVPVADLGVEKNVNNSNPNYGDIVKWTIIINNYGPNDATGVLVRDSLPKGLTLIESSQYVDSDGCWNVGDLRAGDEKELEIICRVSQTGTFKNIVSIWGNEFDPDTSNNNFEKTINVAPACDLSITKTVSKYNYKTGDIVTYSIKLTNNGPDRARSVKVDEISDKSLVFKSVKVSKGTFDNSTKTWSIDSLAKGESAEMLIKALATASGTVKNVVSVTTKTFDYNQENNKDESVVNVTEKENVPQNSTKKFDNPNPHQNNPKKSENNKVYGTLDKNHSTGNSFAVLLISLIFSMIFLGGNISKKR